MNQPFLRCEMGVHDKLNYQPSRDGSGTRRVSLGASWVMSSISSDHGGGAGVQ